MQAKYSVLRPYEGFRFKKLYNTIVLYSVTRNAGMTNVEVCYRMHPANTAVVSAVSICNSSLTGRLTTLSSTLSSTIVVSRFEFRQGRKAWHSLINQALFKIFLEMCQDKGCTQGSLQLYKNLNERYQFDTEVVRNIKAGLYTSSRSFMLTTPKRLCRSIVYKISCNDYKRHKDIPEKAKHQENTHRISMWGRQTGKNVGMYQAMLWLDEYTSYEEANMPSQEIRIMSAPQSSTSHKYHL